MASIYKRGKIWWIHYLIGGKSVSRSLKTTSARIALDKKNVSVQAELAKSSAGFINDGMGRPFK